MPAGNRVLPLRSNIEAISEFVFSQIDPDFAKECRAAGSVVIIGGENYGQGSSREHAALAPRLSRGACQDRQELCPHPQVEPLQLRHPAADLQEPGGLRAALKRECRCGFRRCGSALNRETREIPVEVDGQTILYDTGRVRPSAEASAGGRDVELCEGSVTAVEAVYKPVGAGLYPPVRKKAFMATKSQSRRPALKKPGTGIIATKNIGLRGVTVADTRISDVDGENGILIYRGYRIEELAENSTFEETAYLLLHDELPAEEQLKDFTQRLEKARPLPSFILQTLRGPAAWRKSHGCAAGSRSRSWPWPIPSFRTSRGKPMTRRRSGSSPESPLLLRHGSGYGMTANRCRRTMRCPMQAISCGSSRVKSPIRTWSRDLDTALVLHADHSFNASTFACREVVSTQAHMYAGVAAGVGALSGSLHGGANARVMKMLQELQNETERRRVGAAAARQRSKRSWAWAMRCTRPRTPVRNS